MAEQIAKLDEWLNSLAEKHPAAWDSLPDIGLYMDQVQTFIDRQLGIYRKDENDRLLTPAMINNYIKDELIPRAELKKYTPVHLALLIIIGTLKQVHSIPNLNQLLASYREPADVAGFYSLFLENQRDSLLGNSAQVLAETAKLAAAEPAAGDDEEIRDALRNLSLKLSIEARIRILIAEKILDLLAEPKPEAVPEKKREKTRKPRSQPEKTAPD